ncbi:hypothetical protein CsSME_00031984 [Camellia sinensis var. sinensis]
MCLPRIGIGDSLLLIYFPSVAHVVSYWNALLAFIKMMTSFILVRALQILKSSLGLPPRFGWNGDPCVPQQHPWSGANCQFDVTSGKWVIDGLFVLNLMLHITLFSFLL